MLKTIYLFEIEKLFFSKVNLIAMFGVVVIVVFLAITSASQDQSTSPGSVKNLDGRTIDELFFEELRPALKDEKVECWVTAEEMARMEAVETARKEQEKISGKKDMDNTVTQKMFRAV